MPLQLESILQQGAVRLAVPLCLPQAPRFIETALRKPARRRVESGAEGRGVGRSAGERAEGAGRQDLISSPSSRSVAAVSTGSDSSPVGLPAIPTGIRGFERYEQTLVRHLQTSA